MKDLLSTDPKQMELQNGVYDEKKKALHSMKDLLSHRVVVLPRKRRLNVQSGLGKG